MAPHERLHPGSHHAVGAPQPRPVPELPDARRWIVVACAKEKFWRRLVEALGRADLADDPRFRTYEERRAHRAALEDVLDGILATRTTAAWVDLLADAGVPCAPVNDVAHALADPQTAARGMIIETPHPRWGVVRHVASPVRAGLRRGAHRRAPARDEDRDSILRDVLGYDDAQRRALDRTRPDTRSTP